ncbi:hypothetical protein [Actinomadura macrotermitis]|uniref:Mce-associated membrane protein n=1 Tax=Actinomadura macrotermitis TaxID=2585200 RepID=A0A7K0BTN2_9ACTN|nr:hypothetical protein [Actinomadura macrotermitis]MQY04054.1 hypothetical protein [Actinomadura macrotermitis]
MGDTKVDDAEKVDLEKKPAKPEKAEQAEKPAAKKPEPAKKAQRRPEPEPPKRDLLRTTALAVTGVAAACAAWFGWGWYAAAHDDSLRYSKVREQVLQSAEQGVQNLSTLDHRNVAAGLKTWQDSSTGDLHDQLVQGAAAFEADVRKAQTVTSAKVLEGAVTELDERGGRASVIVAVQITVTPPQGAPSSKQSRLVARLARTPAGWKVSALGQAPIGGGS